MVWARIERCMGEEVAEFHCILRTEHKRCYKGLDLGVEERVREVYSFWPEATEKWGTHLLRWGSLPKQHIWGRRCRRVSFEMPIMHPGRCRVDS